MNALLKITVPAIPGAIIAGLLWLFVNRFVPQAGAGLLERQAWPLNSVYACAAFGAILAAGSGMVSVFFTHRRRQAMEAAAALAGLKFHGAVVRSEVMPVQGLNVLQPWSEGSNYAIGTVDRTPVQIVDVRTVRSSQSLPSDGTGHRNRNTTTTEYQTVFLLPAGETPFPVVSLLRRNRMAWAIGLLGLQGLEFQADGAAASEQDRQTVEQFRRDFFVTQGPMLKSGTSASDPNDEVRLQKQLEQMIGLTVLRQLVDKREWNLEFCPSHVAFWKSKKTVRPGELSQQLHEVAGLHRLFVEGHRNHASEKLVVRGSAKMQIDTSMLQFAPFVVGGCAGMFLAFALFLPIFFLFAEKMPWIVFVWPIFGMAVMVTSAVVASRLARNWRS